jgi:integral membrane protein
MAFVTGVLLAFMTVVGLPFKYVLGETATWYAVGWMAHGWLYIAYVAVALDLVFRMKWHLGKALLILLAGTVPFMSFVAERWVTKRVRPLLADTSGADAVADLRS